MNNMVTVFYIVLSCLLLIQPSSGATPQVTLSQSFITPRQNIFNDTTSDHWKLGPSNDVYHTQTDLQYQQTLGDHFKFSTHLDYGSGNYRFADQFRLQTLYGQIIYPNQTLKLGRLTQWNSLVNARFDGADYSYKSSSMGELNIAGGRIASFTGKSSDESFFITSWGKATASSKITLQVWGNFTNSDESVKSGLVMTQKLKNRFNLITYISWNFSENKPYYNRVRLDKRYGHHKILFDLTHRNYDLKKIYPFIKKSLFVSPTATFSLLSNFENGTQLINKIGVRISNKNCYFYSGTLSTHSAQFSLTAGNNSDDIFIGGDFSFSANLIKAISYGGSISYNSLDFAGNIETQNSLGAYTWAKWKPVPNFLIEIFARVYQNSYFSTDGRGGLNVIYTF